MDCTCNCVAMPITYSLVVATGAFQCPCSDEYTHASTLKQRAVPDSTARSFQFPQWFPFAYICPFQNWNSQLAKARSLSFHSSADRPFLGMAEWQHTISESNACIIIIKHLQTPVPNDVARDVPNCSKLFQTVPNCGDVCVGMCALHRYAYSINHIIHNYS